MLMAPLGQQTRVCLCLGSSPHTLVDCLATHGLIGRGQGTIDNIIDGGMVKMMTLNPMTTDVHSWLEPSGIFHTAGIPNGVCCGAVGERETFG